MKKLLLSVIACTIACSSLRAQTSPKNLVGIDLQYANCGFNKENKLKYYDLKSVPSVGMGISYQRLLSDSLLILPVHVSVGLYQMQRAGFLELSSEQVIVNTSYIDVPVKIVITSNNNQKSPFGLLLAFGVNFGLPYNQELNSSVRNSNADTLVLKTKSAYNIGLVADFGFMYKLGKAHSFICLRSLKDVQTNYYKYSSIGLAFGVQVPL